MDLNGQKWTKVDPNGQNDIVHFGPFRSIQVHLLTNENQ